MLPDATILSAWLAVEGEGSGPILKLEAPLSFWGGLDSGSGLIVERTHPQFGASLSGKVLVMERAKGSSSSSSVLAEAIRNGKGPAAIVMRHPDLIVGLGCIVASELYGIHVPLVGADDALYTLLGSADAEATVRVSAGATPLQGGIQEKRGMVAWGGIEPPTRGFSIRCSTN